MATSLSVRSLLQNGLLDIDSAMLVGHGHRVPGGISEKMRADAFEALIGAVYLIYGMDEARRIVREVLF